MTLNEIEKQLIEIVAEPDSREYENNITCLSKQINVNILNQLYNTLSKYYNDESLYLKIYCLLFTYERRHGNTDKCIKLYDSQSTDIQNSYIAKHLYSIALKQTGKYRDLITSIEYAKEVSKYMRDNIGVLHNLAEGIITLYEQSKDYNIKTFEKDITESLELLDDINKLEPSYAKFYATRARAYLLKNDYYLANKNIHIAIDKEDSTSNDYSIRLSQYYLIKSKIEMKQQTENVLENVKQHSSVIEDNIKKTNLEILSFFIAVISFIFANVQIMTKFKLIEAMQLSFLFSSSLLMALSGFMIFYSRDKSIYKFIGAMVIAIFMLFVSYLIPKIW